MAYKQITSCLGGAPFDVDFGSIPGINNGDILYLTFTNPSFDGCYTVDANAFTFTQTVNTTTPSFVDCVSCLATITTPTPTPTPTPTTTPAYTEYGLTTFGYGDSASACASLNPTPPVYALPGYTVPIVTMIFYSDPGLTTPYVGNGPGVWLLLERGGTTWGAVVDTNGELLNYSLCSVTPSSTSTPTPTQTPTPTPCPCNEFSISIGSTDTNDATGNTGGLAIYNGVVVWAYTDCNTGLATEDLLSPGTYSLCACGLGGSLSYWKNNVQSAVTDSSVSPVGPCVLSPSPTPTPTITPSPTPGSGIWTISNFDCGLGSINDVGINSSFMNSLPLGPSNFPLTSSLSGSRAYPSGVINGTNLIQLNVTTNLPGVGGCAIISVYVNSVLTAQSQFDSNPFPQISVNLNIGDDVLVQVQCYGTPCATPPAVTPTQTPTNTETPTPTQTPTPSITIGASPTQTETQTPTPTQTPTNTETPTPTNTQTQTPTNTQTQTQTPTPTTTVTASQGFIVQMVDCTNSSNVFRFDDTSIPSTTGLTYFITGSTEFEGCATVVPTNGSGPIYDGTGVTFILTAGGCGDSVCPRSSNRAALLSKCSNSTIFYANVEEDTAFVGAAYLYQGECYSFVEFSGPGGPDIGDPDFSDCNACVPTATPTATPQSTPTNTPTVSVTPSACTYTDFCFYTMLPSLSGYSGNYTVAGIYNTKDYYTGDGIITAVIYYTGTYWCLASGATPGGTCVLQGATPCYSQCPDIAANDFVGGICPTPTPTPVDCSIFNFNAYFDCDWEPLPTPTPSVACDDVNFIIDSAFVTPTPTPSGDFCNTVGISFSMSGYTPAITPTVTLTPSITLTRTVDVAGQVKFNMLDETFSCVSVKVLTDCQTGVEYYVNDNLIYDGIPVITGITMFASINETNVCVTYTRDDSNFSSNATVDSIFQIYTICGSCSTLPTPTPTVTSTPTNTPSTTPTKTPTNTPTSTLTPSPTSTIGSTPPPTPTQTTTQTPTQTTTQTITPTPSTTPNYVYVYQSCSPISPNLVPTQIIQSVKVTIASEAGIIFKDNSGICWTYIGRFEPTYIAGSGVTTITYTGNYFDGIPTNVFTTCESCQTVPPIDLCPTYQYWSGTRCDNGQTIIVKSCYIVPTSFTINTFDFGTVGQTTGYLDFNVKVGEIATGNDGTDDFCIKINSEVGVQTASYIVTKPFGTTITSCSDCPSYRKYTARACDNSEQNVVIYTPTSVAPFAFAGSDGGNIVSVTTSNTCYTILNYDGIVIDYYITPSTANFVLQGYADCQLCSEASASRTGIGGE